MRAPHLPPNGPVETLITHNAGRASVSLKSSILKLRESAEAAHSDVNILRSSNNRVKWRCVLMTPRLNRRRERGKSRANVRDDVAIPV